MGSRSPAGGIYVWTFLKLMIDFFFNFQLIFYPGVLNGVIRKGSINKSVL